MRVSLFIAFVVLACFTPVVLVCCAPPVKINPKPNTSTEIDTKRLDEAVEQAEANQRTIKKDGISLGKDLPEDARPPRIVEKATDTEVQLALAKQTIADLKAKDTTNEQAAAENAKVLAELEAQVAKLQEEIDSGTAWWFFLMIAGGAIGIPISIAVMLKIDKAWGGFFLIIAIGSVVTGYVLRDYASWIGPIGGAAALIGGGFLAWRRLSQHEDQAEEDETILRETVRSAEAMKKLVPDWHKDEVQEQITRHQRPETIERIKKIRVRDKLTENPEHLRASRPT